MIYGSLSVVLGRSKTTPSEASCEINSKEKNHNLSRSQTEKKENELKIRDKILLSPHPAEKLSERKRVSHWVIVTQKTEFKTVRYIPFELTPYIFITYEQKKIIENLVKIKNDGTVEVDVDQSAQIVPNLFGLDIQTESDINQPCEVFRRAVPSYLNIAILIVGTRGDVQPFVAIGKRLKVSIDLFINILF